MQHDGDATTHKPPNTQSFDPANRHSSLRPRSQSLSTPPTADVSSFISLLGTLGNFVNTANSSPTTPQTPSHHNTSTSRHFQVTTPSKLRRYLLYAERHLGIHNASRYESVLAKENYGPDIFEELPDDILLRSPVKMPRGDAIRLKRGCATWWESESKRTRIESGHSSHVSAESSLVQIGHTDSPSSRGVVNPVSIMEVRYELDFPEGGSACYHGPPMRHGTTSDADRRTKYFCEALDSWLPVPEGYCAPWYSSEGREDQENVFLEKRV